MGSQTSSGGLSRGLEWLLAFIGAVNCIVVPFMFAANQSELFPLPGLYFIQIALLGVLAMVAVAAQTDATARWNWAPWLCAGTLTAFAILGGFSIGFFLIPAVVAFFLTGILMDRRAHGNSARHLGLAVVMVVMQGALMLMLIMVR